MTWCRETASVGHDLPYRYGRTGLGPVSYCPWSFELTSEHVHAGLGSMLVTSKVPTALPRATHPGLHRQSCCKQASKD